MAQEILVAPRGGRSRFGVGVRLLGAAPGAARRARTASPCFSSPAKGIERRAMGRHVQKAVLLHLSLDLDQRVAQPAQQRHRHRLVVDEGAAAAVGADQAAQRSGRPRRRAPARPGTARAGWFLGRSNDAATDAWSRRRRTAPDSARAPSARPSASIRMDLPAPVSPVSAPSPPTACPRNCARN